MAQSKSLLGLLILLLVCAVVTATAASRTSDRTIDRTIAKINDDILTESDLADVIADVTGRFNSRFVSAFESATSESVLSMFDKALLVQEARRMQLVPPADELHSQVETMIRDIRANFPSDKEFHQSLAAEHISLDQLKAELLERSKIDFMVFHVVNRQYSVSDVEVEQYKEQQRSQGETLGSFRLRRLGIPLKENGGAEAACRKARALVARIITEGISFEEGIRQYSQVPGAAADGGDMGYMSIDKLSAEVRAAVESLEVGQASAPVIAGGYANVFYVDGKRGARSALREKKFFEAREALLEKLRRKAILQVFDQRLMDIMPRQYRAALTTVPSGRNERPSGLLSTPTPAAQQMPNMHRAVATPTPQPQRRFPLWFGQRQ